MLFRFHLCEDVDSCLRIHKLLRVQPINEALNRVVLLYLVEADDRRFPRVVQDVEFFVFAINNLLIEHVALRMLSCVLGILVLNLLLHEFVDLWLEVEGDVYEFLPHSTQV